jgi:hypothetical protein
MDPIYGLKVMVIFGRAVKTNVSLYRYINKTKYNLNKKFLT